MKRLAWIVILFSLSFPLAGFADDDQGQHHHEDLTATQLGTVHFPVSCAAEVQKPFERGVALLHSFWYEEAEKEFVQVANDDPSCAMAHWGVAMSIWHQLWNQPDAKVIERGWTEVRRAEKNRGQVGDLERAYIAAMHAFYGDSKKHDHDARARAYSDAMKQVYESYPDDHEAAAFYALSLLASEPHEDTTFANRKAAAAILEKLLVIERDHPGVAHYLIHSYDTPSLAQLGIPAARRYAQIAPAAPHALHMPSHIFARVGLWQDDINSNLASIAATRKTVWAAKATSSTPWTSSSMPTCRAAAKPTRRRSSMKSKLCPRRKPCTAWTSIRGSILRRALRPVTRWSCISGAAPPL